MFDYPQIIKKIFLSKTQMISITKNFSRISAALGFCFFAYLFNSSDKAFANACAENPSSLSNSCYITPEVYKITIYEMGLCTSDPLAGTYVNSSDVMVTDYAIDESSCSPTFKNSNGSLVNLAGGASQTLSGGTDIRPSVGSYPHAYVKIKNVFGLKGNYTINDVTYYSKDAGLSDTSASNNAEWDQNLVDFGKGSECEPLEENRSVAASETFTSGTTGTMKAVLASVSGETYTPTTQANCGSSTRLFGAFSPTNPVVITEQTNGLEVRFTITNRGMSVYPGNNPYVVEFGGGPFTPSFTTF